MIDISARSRRIQNITFGVILVILFILVCHLFVPFFTVLLWSILLYIILKPVHHRCSASVDRSTVKGKLCNSAIALAFALGTVVLILVPLLFVGMQIIKQLMELIRMATNYLTSHYGSDTLDNIARIIREVSSDQINITAGDIRAQILGHLTAGLQNLLRFSGQAVRNTGFFLLNLIFMVFILFFFFVDGDYLARRALRVIPIRKEYIKALVTKFKVITRRLVLGYIMVALAEAVVAYFIFTFFRVSGSLVFAALIFVFSFIPLIGPSFVWIPLGLLRIFDGDMGGGIVLMLVSAGFISTIENFLRPVILRDSIQLHPLLIFFAILGGLSIYGFNGLILGPMIMIIFLTVIDMFLSEYKLEEE